MAEAGARILYLSYDGLTDPLGRSQILPYLVGLAGRGHRITLVSLDKADLLGKGRATAEALCREAGIEWHPLPYRARPPIASALGNIRALRREADLLHRAHGFDLVHCRSDLAGLAGLALKRRHGVPMLYDMRALWPDERAEGGAWDQSKPLYRAIFRYFKARQRELLSGADYIVTLSEAGRRAVLTIDGATIKAPISVIPCCADFGAFTLPIECERVSRRRSLGVEGDQKLLIHLGSIGCNVMLAEMLDFFALYSRRHEGAKLLFLTPEPSGAILAAARGRGVADAVRVRSATREEVPGWIGASDLGLFFVRPVYSKQAASPTKLGEMLAVGLPVVTNRGVGDVAEIVADVGAGVVLDRFDSAAYGETIDRLDGLTIDSNTIRTRSLPWFDVNLGIDRYDAIYRRLATGGE